MIRSMNIAWCVQRWSELHPQKPALIFKEQTITYEQLNHRSNRTACWLQSMGIEKGDRIAVMLRNEPEFIELYLACARLGAIFVPVNFRLALPELAYTLDNSKPRLFVFDPEYLDMVEQLDLKNSLPPILLATTEADAATGSILNYSEGTAAYEGQKPFLTKSLGPIDPEEPHVVMYTSGTTGEPKGAVLSHRKTFFNCLNADIFFKLHFDDTMLIVLPLFHSGGLFIQASPMLFKGGTMIIHRKFSPKRIFETIKDYKVTKFLGVPTIYKALIKYAPSVKDLNSLKVSAIGGELSSQDLLMQCKEAGFPLRQVMGQTETSILLWASEEASIAKPGTVGCPVYHAEVNIVDQQGMTVAPDEIGEIVVRGSIMMTEYWRDPVRTEETIVNGWLHTGDLARRDKDGYFYLVDRAKNMYISGGENVYPAEVERVLRTIPGIAEAAVIGVPDDTWGETGHAFIVKKPEAEISVEQLNDFLKDRLAKFKWPRTYSFHENFARTSLGKIRKGVLRDEIQGKIPESSTTIK